MIIRAPIHASQAPRPAADFGAYVAGKSQSVEKRHHNWPSQPPCDRTDRVLPLVDGRPEAVAISPGSREWRHHALLRQFSPEWPKGNICAGIRSTYSCWIGGSQLQDIVEPTG
jgi:hypothetical protein